MIRTVLAMPRSPMRARIRAWLGHAPEIRVVGIVPDGPAAVRRIGSSTPDLVILHVDLPRLDGFGVLDALPPLSPPPVVILLAEGPEAAVRAFGVRATDYLQLPFDEERLARSLDRARKRLADRTPRTAGGDAAAEPAPGRLVLRSRRRLIFLDPVEIRWVRAARRRTELHLQDRVVLADIALGTLARQLSADVFIQISRSVMVRRECIREIRGKSHGDRWVHLDQGDRVVLTRSHRAQLLPKG